ncbi:Thioesterase superfamily [Macrophomina phaseolina MS6]|uniref:Thioesterase superfamily n=1 Tax=Macrophomina phaseolina (strain MS6) TaxID=1126212 RepID=K2S9V2_MACPH|nr:Thioesterase superfamily [Macrophomina phaseolina MS6]
MSQEPRKRRKVAHDPQAVFQCTYPGCGSSYRRKEHLNRHAQQHTKEPKFVCTYCARKFFRRDILRRHLELHDEDVELTRSRTAKACDVCRSRKSRCDGNAPCRTCSDKRLSCTYGQSAPKSQPSSESSPSAAVENTEDVPTPRALLPQPDPTPAAIADLSFAIDGLLMDASMLIPANFALDGHAWANFPHLDAVRRHLDAYWTLFHPKWLFLHKASFRPEQEPPFLLLSMVMTSLWVGGDDASRVVALDLHRRLMDKWDFAPTPSAPFSPAWPLGTFQGILLHLILALAYGLPLSSPTGSTASVALNTHALLTDLVRCARRLGLFSYAAMHAQFHDADLVFVTWVRVEEVKRFDLILFRLWGVFHDCEWARVNGLAGEELTWADLRFQAPEPDELWTADGIREFMARRERCGLQGARHDEEGSWICNVMDTGSVATPRAVG